VYVVNHRGTEAQRASSVKITQRKEEVTERKEREKVEIRKE
jgi:hypothetical protein